MLGELTCICTYVFHQSHTKYSYTSYPGIFSMNTLQSMVINCILFFDCDFKLKQEIFFVSFYSP